MAHRLIDSLVEVTSAEMQSLVNKMLCQDFTEAMMDGTLDQFIERLKNEIHYEIDEYVKMVSKKIGYYYDYDGDIRGYGKNTFSISRIKRSESNGIPIEIMPLRIEQATLDRIQIETSLAAFQDVFAPEMISEVKSFAKEIKQYDQTALLNCKKSLINSETKKVLDACKKDYIKATQMLAVFIPNAPEHKEFMELKRAEGMHLLNQIKRGVAPKRDLTLGQFLEKLQKTPMKVWVSSTAAAQEPARSRLAPQQLFARNATVNDARKNRFFLSSSLRTFMK